MKINLPVFKDKDTNDAVTYQSWRWDLMVYHCTRCRDCRLLPYAIWSLQGYSGELGQSSRIDITLDDMLMILDEHYNNVKALDALNQELFQLQMADKETISDWGVCLSRHLQVLAASIPNHFPPNRMAELKQDHFYGGLPKQLKAMVAYLKASMHDKLILITFELQGRWRRKNLWSYPGIHGTKQWIMLLNQITTSFFPLQMLKGNQPTPKMPTMHLAHLEEESAKRDKGGESEDQDSINGVTEEFIVHLTRAVKDAQVKEKCCYHCSSLEHFICNCPLVRASRNNV